MPFFSTILAVVRLLTFSTVSTGGATSGKIIQLRKEYDPTLKNNYEIIENIRGYTDLKSMKLFSNKQLEIIVGFKGNFAKKPDTLFIKIE